MSLDLIVYINNIVTSSVKVNKPIEEILKSTLKLFNNKKEEVSTPRKMNKIEFNQNKELKENLQSIKLRTQKILLKFTENCSKKL